MSYSRFAPQSLSDFRVNLSLTSRDLNETEMTVQILTQLRTELPIICSLFV
jgi:hypothetical protein